MKKIEKIDNLKSDMKEAEFFIVEASKYKEEINNINMVDSNRGTLIHRSILLRKKLVEWRKN